MKWVLKKFEELTPQELYNILQLRNEVFAVEQNCVYPDMDNKDQPSWHLMCLLNDKLVAYTRLLPPGIAYSDPSIGRVVTSSSIRKTGTGRELMLRSIECCEKLFGKQPITIGAQFYLKSFYESLGFVKISEIYLEDGIEHITMRKEVS